jgi:hypothetical protein
MSELIQKQIKVLIEFQEGLLGTKPGNPQILEDFVASKYPEALPQEEIDTLPVNLGEELEKGTTVFNRDTDGCPFIFDYQIKGFFKDTQGGLQRLNKMPAYKKVIDKLIFVGPRRIRLIMPEGAKLGYCVRSLRAQTMQGERTSLARSEEAPAGTKAEVVIKLVDKGLEPLVLQWLKYGELSGIGQWRNSGQGRFTHQILK